MAQQYKKLEQGRPQLRPYKHWLLLQQTCIQFPVPTWQTANLLTTVQGNVLPSLAFVDSVCTCACVEGDKASLHDRI